MLHSIFGLGMQILKQLPPESAHRLTLRLLPLLHQAHLLPGALHTQTVRWQGIEFGNPIGLAAGFDKNAEVIDALAACGFGFVEVGTLTPKPQPGNPKPRMFRISESGAIINRMGFNNKGVDYAAARLKAVKSAIIKGVNVGKNATTPQDKAADDYVYCMERVYAYCDYVVANISSPNTQALRELQHGQARDQLFAALARTRDRLTKQTKRRVPVLIKIAPDVGFDEIASLVHSLIMHDLDGIIATNTTIQRPSAIANHPNASQQGGLSGTPLGPLAVATAQQVAALLPPDKLLIGAGGIGSVREAQAFFDAGAQLVQLYSALTYQGPGLVHKLASAHTPTQAR